MISKLIIQRPYGHKNSGHETLEWENSPDLDKQTHLQEVARAFNAAMLEGMFALAKPAQDSPYIPVSEFDPNAYEIVVSQPVRGG